jgi:hypothetical protein
MAIDPSNRRHSGTNVLVHYGDRFKASSASTLLERVLMLDNTFVRFLKLIRPYTAEHLT